MKRLKAPSPALVIALIALFVALGGTSYAAIKLPKNSVGSKQLKKNAVTGTKIKNGAVTASKINPSGLTVPNATHATTADSATSATSATNATNATHATSASSAATATSPSTLGAGQTETGTYYAVADNGPDGGFLGASISFTFPLNFTPVSTAVTGQNVWYIAAGATPPSECPGTVDNPKAAAGNVCIYEELLSGNAGAAFVDQALPPTKFGLGVAAETETSDWTDLVGRWAATGAPSGAAGHAPASTNQGGPTTAP